MPEGATVKIETVGTAAQEDLLAAALAKLVKPRFHLPEDYAFNHGHYVRGGCSSCE